MIHGGVWYPLEPVHAHIAEGNATRNATKIWITSTGKAFLCNNMVRIPERTLSRLLCVVEANSAEFVQACYTVFVRHPFRWFRIDFH